MCCFGYYSNKDSEIVVKTKEDTYNCISENIIPQNLYIRDVNTGVFIDRLAFSVKTLFLPPVIDRNIKNSLPYDSRGGMYSLIYAHSLYKPTINKTVEKFAPALKDLTFGVEFETVNGAVPAFKCKQLGLMPLRDGSIAGLEYATIPLQGEKGLQTRYRNDCRGLESTHRNL